MKGMKLTLAVAASALLLAAPAFAFHSGGVAECEGCHTMHNSLDGAAMNSKTAQFTAGPNLLQGSDRSSACLNCHENVNDTGPTSYHISTADTKMPGLTGIPLQRTPGGDFGWLRRDYPFTVRGSALVNAGERRGHNVVASDYGYLADTTLLTAPGGTFDATKLACSSCHDPHGKYRRNADGTITTTGKAIRGSGSYDTSASPDTTLSVGVFRILGGKDYAPKSYNAGLFANDPPAAVAPATYNRTEATTQTRVAYGKGMSEWCANCHTNIHNNSLASNMRHPTGDSAKLGADIAANYNAYVKSGDLSNLDNTKSYTSLVPFEEGVADQSVASYTLLKAHAKNNDSFLNGPEGTNANVNCLSCHRAHASGFASMLRFAHENEFMTVADATTGASIYPEPTVNAAVSQGLTAAQQQAAYYDRPATQFAPFQRLLCNKCHAKD